MQSHPCAICGRGCTGFLLDPFLGPAVCPECSERAARRVLDGTAAGCWSEVPLSEDLRASFASGAYMDPLLDEGAESVTDPVLGYEAWALVEGSEAVIALGPGARFHQLGIGFEGFVNVVLGPVAAQHVVEERDLRPFALLGAARALTLPAEDDVRERAAKILARPPVADSGTLERLRRLLHPN